MKNANKDYTLRDCNEPYECVKLLMDLNSLIETLYKLSDVKYYLDYCFGEKGAVGDCLKRLGFGESEFCELAIKFEDLRSCLFGSAADWDYLTHMLLQTALDELNNTIKHQDNIIKKLNTENEKLKG